jgi:Tfp pilus assembly protein PilV
MKTTRPTSPLGLARRRGARARPGGFSLIEVLFAIGMLGIGIVGVLSLFTTGISAASWSGNVTSAAMEAQSLYTRVVAEVDTNNERVFLNRINDPKNPVAQDPAATWIHTSSDQEDPVLVDEEREWWWQCRVSKYQMDLESPLDQNKDADKMDPSAKPYPMGLYQIAIAIYRNWRPGRQPVVVYTTFVTAGY